MYKKIKKSYSFVSLVTVNFKESTNDVAKCIGIKDRMQNIIMNKLQIYGSALANLIA